MRLLTETIDFFSGNLQIHGIVYIPKGNGKFPGVVMCHGMASDHRSMRPSAQRLARKGTVVLALDLRGHGMSDGTLDGNIGSDVVAAVETLKDHSKVDSKRIALVGHSMGALASLYAATIVNKAKAVVLLSIPAEVGNMAEFWNPMYAKAERLGTTVLEFPRIGPLPYAGWFNQQVSRCWMTFRKYRLCIDIKHDTKSWDALNPLDNIEKIGSIPKLFIHSKADKWLPYKKTVALYDKAQQPKEIILFERGYHVTPLLPGKLRDRWMAWLISALK